MEQISITEFTPVWGDGDLIDLVMGSKEELGLHTEDGGQVLAIDEDGERVDGGPVHYWSKDEDLKVAVIRKLLDDYPDAVYLVLEGMGYEKWDDDDEPHPTGEWWQLEIYRTPEAIPTKS